MTVARVLLGLSQWLLGATCLTSGYFVLAATFVEYEGYFPRVRQVRICLFRWWAHELTAAQVLMDLCLFLTLLPALLRRVLRIDFPAGGGSGIYTDPKTVAGSVYVDLGLALTCAIVFWRTDATSRAKARERARAQRGT